MIQSARIIFLHPQNESFNNCIVNKSRPTYELINTNYYKQNVYDPSDSKIGEIADVLINKEGRITAVIISVGGFLGMGEKDVAAPFEAIGATQKGNEWYLVMNTTKDALKNAPGYKYDIVSPLKPASALNAL
jgi:sporulation protein YlmC with PRC-barrel domain